MKGCADLKISVSNYSYWNAIKKGEITPFECIAKSAELGFDAIEFVDFVDFPAGKEDEWEETAEKYRKECERVGLEISSLTVSADLLKNRDNDIIKLKKYIDIAAMLGTHMMRHDATVGYPRDSAEYCSFDRVADTLAEAFREVTEYAAEKGIRTMTENHGFFSQDSDRVEKLYNAISHPNFGLLIDIGNFTCADENPVHAVTALAPFAIYVHAKDFIIKSFYDDDPGEGSFRTRAGNYLTGTIIGHGNVPVRQCLYQLKSCGYDGYIAVEFEGMENPFDGVRIGKDNIRKYWDQI